MCICIQFFFLANRREMRYHSFNFANSLFGLMLSKANQLLSTLLEESTNPQRFTDEEYVNNNIIIFMPKSFMVLYFVCSYARVNTYLQFVKVYTHWLGINVDLWEPVRTEE